MFLGPYQKETYLNIHMSDINYIRNAELRKLTTYITIMHNGFNILDVPITYHCNLNCAYCGFLSPMNDKYFLDVESFRKNIKRLSEILPSEKFDRIHLVGGEPLLHPDISLFFKYAREAYPNTKIYLITNGLLLNRMNDDFYQSVIDNNINMLISEYPVLKNKEELIKKFTDKGIRYHFDKKEFFNKKLFDLEGKQDPYKNLSDYCVYCNCMTFIEDKLYLCSDPFFIKMALGKYIKDELPEDNSGENIYQYSSFDEIVNKLVNTMPVNYCKYCKWPLVKKEWHISKNSLLEYTSDLC